jgi:hypothetical protein
MELGHRVAGSRIVGSVGRWRQARATALLPGTVSVVVPAGNPRLRRRHKNRPGGSTASRRGCPSRSASADRRRARVLVVKVRLAARIRRRTLAPRDLTRRLMVEGPYGYLRNPRRRARAGALPARLRSRRRPYVSAGIAIAGCVRCRLGAPLGAHAVVDGASVRRRPRARGPASRRGRRSARAWAIDGVAVTVGRPIARQTRVGFGPGEPVEISYDRGRPIRGGDLGGRPDIASGRPLPSSRRWILGAAADDSVRPMRPLAPGVGARSAP